MPGLNWFYSAAASSHSRRRPQTTVGTPADRGERLALPNLGVRPGTRSTDTPAKHFCRTSNTVRVCHGVPPLLVAFSSSDEVSAAATSDEAGDSTVELTVGDRTVALSRSAAAELRAAVGDALEQRQAFARTAGVHRPNGEYVVQRCAADSTGNAVVFDSFASLRTVFEALPERFGADDVDCTTGSRRHMVVWHFAEHPAFPCTLAARRPLTVEKAP